MLKKAISLLILVMYLHGMSGYTMSFHTCTITGFENVYTGYGLEDPCGEAEMECTETSDHFEPADCCDIDQTFVSVDDDSDVSNFKLQVKVPLVIYTLFPSYFDTKSTQPYSRFTDHHVKPPKLCDICIFRI
jgi:hypothetical protein